MKATIRMVATAGTWMTGAAVGLALLGGLLLGVAVRVG